MEDKSSTECLQEQTCSRACATHFITYYYFFTVEVSTPSDTTVEDHTPSVACNCMFNTFKIPSIFGGSLYLINCINTIYVCSSFA
jgi:hypothetical protein